MKKRKLRVLQVGKYYPPTRGGIETLLELLCQGLKNEVTLEVVVANEERDDVSHDMDGVSVRRLGSVLKLAGSPICPGIARAFRQADADIVHIHLPNPVSLMAYHLCGSSRSKLVCTYHSDIVRQRILGGLIGPLQNMPLRKAALIASSPNLIESSAVLRQHRPRCEVIPFGIDPSLSKNVAETEIRKVRKAFGEPIVLAVGRLVYYKGFEVLIEAFARVKVPSKLLIIGEGPLRKTFERKIAELGLNGRVYLLGNVPDTAPFYQACNVFTLPSVAGSEAFGVVQLEAMACGKPVINTRLATGVPYVSVHRETGLTVTPGDVEGLAEAIESLLSDPTLRAKYGEAAVKRVHAEFTVGKMVERTLALYQRVTGKS